MNLFQARIGKRIAWKFAMLAAFAGGMATRAGRQIVTSDPSKRVPSRAPRPRQSASAARIAPAA